VSLFEDLVAALEAGQAVVMAMVIGPASAPAGLLGRRLLVFADGGTAGGLGAPGLDMRAIEAAKGLAEGAPPTRLCEWALSAEDAAAIGLAPGEALQVFLEAVLPPETLLIVGAGHIAQPLAQMGKMLGFRVAVLDDRPEFANRERFPMADDVIVGPYDVELARLPLTPSTYVVLVTRGHVQD